FSLWLVTSIVVLPFAWLNYATMLCVSFALLGSAGGRNPARTRAIWAAIASYFLSLFSFCGIFFLYPWVPLLFTILVGERKSVTCQRTGSPSTRHESLVTIPTPLVYRCAPQAR